MSQQRHLSRILAATVMLCLPGRAEAQAQVQAQFQAEPAAVRQDATCAMLKGRVIPASAIGVPSGAATIDAAELLPPVPLEADGAAVRPATPAFCRILGKVAPLDPAAQAIRFQVNLPADWNGKAVQYGGGGYNGSLVTGLLPLRDAPPGDPLPLARGYVTLGTDSGHQVESVPPDRIGWFGSNEEMLANYGHASYKKVHDVAVSVARSFYGRAPARFYYFGGSEGGREGLTMAQRYPDDYDGVVSVVPVVQLSMLFQSYLPNAAPQFAGGWLGPAQVETVARFVARSCDGMDGLEDGVISDALGCARHVDVRRLRCEGGGDTGPACLSDAQIATLDAIHAPHPFPFTMANGLRSYPASLYGHENTPDPRNPTMVRWVTGTAPPSRDIDPATAAQQWLYGANFVRFFVTRDAGFDPLRFRAEDHADRLRHVSGIIDSTDPDLGRFFARGGKLILRENMSDLAQSPLAGIDYFQSVERRLGAEAVKRSARLYLSPGSNHTGTATSATTGEKLPTDVDLLDPLDRWVVDGQAPPDALIQVLRSPSPPFTMRAERPMCQFPSYPRYRDGNPASAGSYVCTPSAR